VARSPRRAVGRVQQESWSSELKSPYEETVTLLGERLPCSIPASLISFCVFLRAGSLAP
jgi:hypothetical protein